MTFLFVVKFGTYRSIFDLEIPPPPSSSRANQKRGHAYVRMRCKVFELQIVQIVSCERVLFFKTNGNQMRAREIFKF